LKVCGFHLVVFNVLFTVMYCLGWLFYDTVMEFHGWLIVCNGVFFLLILPFLLWENRHKH